jgi:hypothetical protein
VPKLGVPGQTNTIKEPEKPDAENRLSGLMRGGSLTVIGVRTSQPVGSRLLYTQVANQLLFAVNAVACHRTW